MKLGLSMLIASPRAIDLVVVTAGTINIIHEVVVDREIGHPGTNTIGMREGDPSPTIDIDQVHQYRRGKPAELMQITQASLGLQSDGRSGLRWTKGRLRTVVMIVLKLSKMTFFLKMKSMGQIPIL